MLERLHIENLAVIENIDIEFTSGFVVLTGETGAGKSIIIDGISMLLGDRASKDIVRSGCKKSVVDGTFSIDKCFKQIKKILNDIGIDIEEKQIILQREIYCDGRSVARINGRPVTVALLKQVGSLVVNIHGQQNNISLLNANSHLEYLDKYASNAKEFQEYKVLYQKAVSIRHKLKIIKSKQKEKSVRMDVLNFQIQEIKSAELYDGIDKALDEKHNILANTEKINDVLSISDELLCRNSGIQESIGIISKKLSSISDMSDKIKSIYQISENIKSEVDDVIFEINSIKDNLDFNDSELNDLEEKISVISELKHKYGNDISEILEYCDNAEDELYSYQNSDKECYELEQQFDTCTDELAEKAKKLTETRVIAAKKLEKNMISELSFLDMPNVIFKVEIITGDATSTGCDTVQFLISTNKGEEPKPLTRIASGGELSRIMLSLRSSLSDEDDVNTLIFDEIDTGVSGMAAQKIAIKLKKMSEFNQVIAVTHLAQIASYADQHLYIYKCNKADRTYTNICDLDYQGRVKEISRILGGINITDSVINTAKEMLNLSHNSSLK